MTTYNTGNPIGSTDVRDLYDNAENLDHAVNSELPEFVDRLGVSRRTFQGIEDSAAVVLAGLGYAVPVPYTAGISLTLPTQTVEYSGEVYAPVFGALPFTTSGFFESANFRLIQGVASADLASGIGAALVGYTPAGTGAVPTDVETELRKFVTPENFGGVADASEVTGTGTDSTAAVQAAIKECEATGKALFLPGKYLITGELVVRKPINIYGSGAGAGYGGAALTGYRMRSGLVVNGTGTKRIRTRINYRGSAADPQDAPLSVALNIQSEFVSLEKFAVYLWFDRANSNPTNYGADWDIGIFNGCRVHLSLEKMHVVGYWREACFWQDVTRGSTWPQFSGPDGVPFEAGTVQHGADGLTMYKNLFWGGKWATRIQGPKPKPGLGWYGNKYTIGAAITVSGVPVEGQTLTLNGQVFTFSDSPSASADIGIFTNANEQASAIAIAAEDFTLASLSAGGSPATRTATYFAEDAIVRVLARDGYTLSTSYTLATDATGLTLSGANVATQADPAPYYEELLGAAVSDTRGAFGSSDVTVTATSFYGTDHHSNRRRNDASGDYLTDTAGGAIYLDGMAGNASGAMQGMRFVSCRFATFEPYRIRLGRVNRPIFIGCHSEGRSSTSRRTTTGGTINFNDADYYGPISVDPKAQNTVIIGFSANLRDAFIPTSVRLTNIAASGNKETTRTTDVVSTTARFDTYYGVYSTRGELDLRARDFSSVVRFRGGVTTYATIGVAGLTFSGSVPNPVIQSSSGNLDLRSGSGGQLFLRAGASTKVVVTSTDFRLTDGVLNFGNGTSFPIDTRGAGSPEGVVAARIGSTYRRTDGGAGTTFYVKESGLGNTGWVEK
jgi:hypothetical protein